MNLGVVSLAFRRHVIAGIEHPTAEACQVAWLTLDQVTDIMPEARAIRVTDALRDNGPFVRFHDGTSLL